MLKCSLENFTKTINQIQTYDKSYLSKHIKKKIYKTLEYTVESLSFDTEANTSSVIIHRIISIPCIDMSGYLDFNLTLFDYTSFWVIL